MDEQKGRAPDYLAAFERLAAVLAKVPAERIFQVDRDASNFVSGMEAAARVQQESRPAM